MPGLLKKDARCPICWIPICAIVDESNSERIKREYYHEKGFALDEDGRVIQVSVKARRARRCTATFTNRAAARIERQSLEVPFMFANAKAGTGAAYL